jgi:hypothetical protein
MTDCHDSHDTIQASNAMGSVEWSADGPWGPPACSRGWSETMVDREHPLMSSSHGGRPSAVVTPAGWCFSAVQPASCFSPCPAPVDRGCLSCGGCESPAQANEPDTQVNCLVDCLPPLDQRWQSVNVQRCGSFEQVRRMLHLP